MGGDEGNDAADEDGNQRVHHRNGQAGCEEEGDEASGLAGVVPVEAQQGAVAVLGGRGFGGDLGGFETVFEEFEH